MTDLKQDVRALADALAIARPFALLDLETTGTDPKEDRIVEVAVIRCVPVEADVPAVETYVRRVNPGVPIPAEASAIHGITDADVRDAPTFVQIAPAVRGMLTGADFAGFNLLRFDLPLLAAEFERVGMQFDPHLSGRRVIDVQRLYHLMHPRDLCAARRTYLDEDAADAHGALADASATGRVLLAQLIYHREEFAEGGAFLPRDLDALNTLSRGAQANWLDPEGALVWSTAGEVVFTFGKHKGKTLREVAQTTDYLSWIVRERVKNRVVQQVASSALGGVFPCRPT